MYVYLKENTEVVVLGAQGNEWHSPALYARQGGVAVAITSVAGWGVTGEELADIIRTQLYVAGWGVTGEELADIIQTQLSVAGWWVTAEALADIIQTQLSVAGCRATEKVLVDIMQTQLSAVGYSVSDEKLDKNTDPVVCGRLGGNKVRVNQTKYRHWSVTGWGN